MQESGFSEGPFQLPPSSYEDMQQYSAGNAAQSPVPANAPKQADDWATYVSRSNCTITVRIRIEVENRTGPEDGSIIDASSDDDCKYGEDDMRRRSDEEFRKLVGTWKQVSNDLWNYTDWTNRKGVKEYRCCRVRYDIDMRVGSGTEGWHQIKVYNDVKLEDGSWTDIDREEARGHWRVCADTGRMAAHEVGHLMEFCDEYPTTRVCSPKPEHYITVGGDRCIMADFSSDAFAPPYHVDQLMASTGTTCPRGCCPQEKKPPAAWDLPPVEVILSKLPQPGPMWERSTPQLFQAVRSGDPMIFARASELVKKRKHGSGRFLMWQLRNGSAGQRSLAAVALGTVHQKKAVGALEAALSDLVPDVRFKASRSLLKLRKRKGIGGMIGLLDSKTMLVSHPPRLASHAAARSLYAYTGLKLGFDTSLSEKANAAAVRAWKGWWAEHKVPRKR